MTAAGILLAGGKSSRFGSDKANFVWQGRTLLERGADHLKTLFDPVILVTDVPDRYRIPGVPAVTDRFAGMGPLGGIHAGLSAANTEFCFFMACDMPFFPERLILRMLELARDWEAVVPSDGETIQPLFAVVRRSAALPAAEALLRQDVRAVRRLYETLSTFRLEKSDWNCPEFPDPFLNLNRPQDVQRLRKLSDNFPHDTENIL